MNYTLHSTHYTLHTKLWYTHYTLYLDTTHYTLHTTHYTPTALQVINRDKNLSYFGHSENNGLKLVLFFTLPLIRSNYIKLVAVTKLGGPCFGLSAQNGLKASWLGKINGIAVICWLIIKQILERCFGMSATMHLQAKEGSIGHKGSQLREQVSSWTVSYGSCNCKCCKEWFFFCQLRLFLNWTPLCKILYFGKCHTWHT